MNQTQSIIIKKRRMSFWEIWNMSFGFLGIQFGFALQNANTSRIFETLGASVDEIPILWIAAPLTGLIVQPIIGYFSDRTWTRLGRRRPYFLVGAICSTIALFFMPNSPSLMIAAGMLWIMDASINISMEPFRAFVGDNLPAEQRTTGFAMQSFFIGVGAVIASLLPWMLSNWFGVSKVAEEGVIADSVKWSYYLGGMVFLLAVLWTVFRSKEYSPQELAAFEAAEEKLAGAKAMGKEGLQASAASKIQGGLMVALFGSIVSWLLFNWELDKELYILSFSLLVGGLLFALAGWMQKSGNTRNGFVNMIDDFQTMPKTMRQLAWVQFFSWFALFSMWIYTTAAVTNSIYGTSDTTSALYNEGADWVGVCFAVYNGVAALVAFALPMLAKVTSRKITHMLCLIAGALGLGSIMIVQSPNFLLLSMVGIGIAWASILSMPYAMLTGALPASKMGYYMGVFNFFIVIPQLVAATILGFLVSHFFAGAAIYAMLLGAISFLLAAGLTLFVSDEA
ncbi:MAG: MFS transporter [Bacteroidota bacterium]